MTFTDAWAQRVSSRFSDQDVAVLSRQHLLTNKRADHPDGYMVSRADALVLGGSFEAGISDARADPKTCARILADNRRFFAGG